MQATIPQLPRAAFWRRASFATTRAARAGSPESFVTPQPRCLGELRLADLLRAGEISVAEFNAERAALLERL